MRAVSRTVHVVITLVALAVSFVAVTIPVTLVGTPAATAAGAQLSVSAEADRSAVEVGERVTVRGTVRALTARGKASRSTVVLQRQDAGGWRTVATTGARKQRTFALRTAPPVGRTTYRVVASALGRTASTSTFTLAASRATAPDPGGDADVEVQRILEETNAARAEAGKAPLVMTTGMNRVAQGWSEQMASEGRMYHNPSYSDQMPQGWSRAGENVAYGYGYTEVVDAWMGSPGHRANILGDFTHIGIGVAEGADGRPYFTQNFGRY